MGNAKLRERLDPALADLIERQEEFQGINIEKIPIGSRLVINTTNSEYTITTLEPNKAEGYNVLVQSNNTKGIFVQPTKVWFSGSTFGGSVLKMFTIGYEMYMEFWDPAHPMQKTLTSMTKEATIYLPNGVSYEMEWQNKVLETFERNEVHEDN